MMEGFVAPGLEGVREAFVANFARTDAYAEVGAALCVYRRGEKIVDLWGGYADAARTRAWTGDALVNVWSTTKTAAAVCVARLVGEGRIAYDQPVAQLWPEFAQAGKGAVTISQVMSHQAGLSGLVEPTTLEEFYDHDLIAGRLAAQAPLFEPGRANCYHAATYGFLTSEIVRRVTGKTLGEYLQDEIAGPIGADFHIGLPASEDGRVAELIAAESPAAIDLASYPLPVQLALANPPMDPVRVNTRAWRAADLPALNGHASARGVARLCAALAGGGEIDGVRILSADALAQMTAIVADRPDMLLGFNPQWGMGVLHNPIGVYGPNPRSFGHSGWGGSFGCADPDAGIAIGYVCNHMGSDLVGDPRTGGLTGALYAALS